jgi:hypothetical protein
MTDEDLSFGFLSGIDQMIPAIEFEKIENVQEGILRRSGGPLPSARPRSPKRRGRRPPLLAINGRRRYPKPLERTGDARYTIGPMRPRRENTRTRAASRLQMNPYPSNLIS